MIDILHRMNSHCKKTGQRLAHVGTAETLICITISFREEQSPIPIKKGAHTVCSIGRFNINVEIFVALQSLLQQLNFLVTLNATALCICAALPITLILVQADHLLDTCLVLFLHAQLELELGQHELDLRAEILSVIFDKI
jgi:hypothetical protein